MKFIGMHSRLDSFYHMRQEYIILRSTWWQWFTMEMLIYFHKNSIVQKISKISLQILTPPLWSSVLFFLHNAICPVLRSCNADQRPPLSRVRNPSKPNHVFLALFCLSQCRWWSGACLLAAIWTIYLRNPKIDIKCSNLPWVDWYTFQNPMWCSFVTDPPWSMGLPSVLSAVDFLPEHNAFPSIFTERAIFWMLRAYASRGSFIWSCLFSPMFKWTILFH